MSSDTTPMKTNSISVPNAAQESNHHNATNHSLNLITSNTHQQIKVIPTSAFTPVNNLPLNMKMRPTNNPTPAVSMPLTPKESPNHLRTVPHSLKKSHVLLERNNSTPNSTDLVPSSPTKSVSSPYVFIPSPGADNSSPDTTNTATTMATIATTTTNTTISNSQMRKPQKLAKRKSLSKTNNTTMKKKTKAITANPKMIEIDPSIINNPKKKEILKINEENYYLKLEVIRLVSNLKALREEVNQNVTYNHGTKSQCLYKTTAKQSQQEGSGKIQGFKKTPIIGNSNNQIPNKSQLSILKSKPAAVSNQMKDSKENAESSSSTTILTKDIISNIDRPNPDSLHLHDNCKVFSNTSGYFGSHDTNKTTTVSSGNKEMESRSRSRKRHHDDDINDLIVSLVDLNHSHPGSPREISKEEFNPTKTRYYGSSHEHNLMNESTKYASFDSLEEYINLERHDEPKSNLNMSSINEPFIDFGHSVNTTTALIPILNDDSPAKNFNEDEDLLSGVSTTPNTMFSSSLSVTNETNESINEFSKLNLNSAHESSIELPDLGDISFNGGSANINAMKFDDRSNIKYLDTYSALRDFQDGLNIDHLSFRDTKVSNDQFRLGSIIDLDSELQNDMANDELLMTFEYNNDKKNNSLINDPLYNDEMTNFTILSNENDNPDEIDVNAFINATSI